MLEITNNLYQVITLSINGIMHVFQPKSSIIIDMKREDLEKEIGLLDTDVLTIREIKKENIAPIKEKHKENKNFEMKVENNE